MTSSFLSKSKNVKVNRHYLLLWCQFEVLIFREWLTERGKQLVFSLTYPHLRDEKEKSGRVLVLLNSNAFAAESFFYRLPFMYNRCLKNRWNKQILLSLNTIDICNACQQNQTKSYSSVWVKKIDYYYCGITAVYSAFTSHMYSMIVIIYRR